MRAEITSGARAYGNNRLPMLCGSVPFDDEHPQRLHHQQVSQQRAEHQHEPGILGERLRMVDPQLRHRREKHQQRKEELLGLRGAVVAGRAARAVENQPGQPSRNTRKIRSLTCPLLSSDIRNWLCTGLRRVFPQQ